MLRLFIGSLIIGILTFLLTFFISPLIISESDIVSIVAEFALSLSNLFFDNMPSIIASYVASLNLAMAAFTMGFFLMLVVLLTVSVSSMSICITKSVISYLQKNRKIDEVQDLPPIDMDSTFNSSATGKNILGRGLDSIDQD